MNAWHMAARVLNYDENVEGESIVVRFDLENTSTFASAVNTCRQYGITIVKDGFSEWYPPHVIVRIWAES